MASSKPEPLWARGTNRKFGSWAWQVVAAGLLLGACDPVSIAAGVGGVTAYGASSPSNEIEQTYYLGSFDPQGQLPPAMYRIRLHGQASALSAVKFASGWVPAKLIDSLSTNITLDATQGGAANTRFTGQDQTDLLSELDVGRRLVQFGPEGFREAPRDHRLVVVMGASPEAFFQAIDGALGNISAAQQTQANAEIKARLFKALVELSAQEQRLTDLERDVQIQLLSQ